MPDVLFFLLLGHIFGDFALQTDYMAVKKGSSKRVLSLHVLIYTVTVGIFWWLGKELAGSRDFPTLTQGLVLAALYVEHWLQDFIKTTKSNGEKQWLFADQALHLSVLYVIRMFF